MTSSQHIDYDALALDALRGVVKACLAQVSRTGLVGEHHFYIAFNTQAQGVGMSKRLKEKYPHEMTIVLQHRFWDLAVEDERFEVKLTFDGIPERLVVPFAAVKVFYDPSVPYVLQFEDVDASQGEGARKGQRRLAGPSPPKGVADAGAGEIEDGQTVETGGSERPDRRRPARRSRTEKVSDDAARPDATASRDPVDAAGPSTQRPRATPDKPSAPPAATPTSSGKPSIAAVNKAESATEGSESDPTDPGGAKIFDLSKFRGKK
jgi:uncharacterized protein